MTRQLFLLASLLPLAVGCASQVDGDHQGTALAKIDGVVNNERASVVADAIVDLVWLTDSPAGDTATITSAPISGDFPAAFHLAIYTPPGANALNMIDDGSAIGVAYIIAARDGADLSDPEHAAPGDLLGMDEDRLIVYLPQDVTAASPLGAFLHGAQTAGYHVYDGHRLTDAERMQRETCEAGLGPDPSIVELYATCGGSSVFDDLIPSANDLATSLLVRIVDDFDSLRPINWK